jgi:hypothetical protein
VRNGGLILKDEKHNVQVKIDRLFSKIIFKWIQLIKIPQNVKKLVLSRRGLFLKNTFK